MRLYVSGPQHRLAAHAVEITCTVGTDGLERIARRHYRLLRGLDLGQHVARMATIGMLTTLYGVTAQSVRAAA